MTHHAPLPATPQDAIAAALDDYWITSDPAGPFHTTEAAQHVDASLTGYGYTITTLTAAAAPRCTCPTPSRANITVTALLALACLLGCLASLARGELGWAAIAFFGAAALANETAASLHTRRAHR
ncbi:hypothetical protein JHN63_15105 [Streptomyces sp. MBT65]|uniref:hypothetical protein n=1 Tax=Streptomyces sp. MBT65 TaxID=1488395 RepID=UPI00190B7530|nr:hypothetical protein [Streptomyces sp. MBT65]MBK3575116.1 hypothetical protein [Streptomyces sp. MBT65]